MCHDSSTTWHDSFHTCDIRADVTCDIRAHLWDLIARFSWFCRLIHDVTWIIYSVTSFVHTCDIQAHTCMPYVGHDSSMMCHDSSTTWHDSFHTRDIWADVTCDIRAHLWDFLARFSWFCRLIHDVTWLIQMCDVRAHIYMSYVCHNSSMTQHDSSTGWHKAFTRVT